MKGLSTFRVLVLLENSAYLSEKYNSNAIKRVIDDISNNFELTIVCLRKNLRHKPTPNYHPYFVNPHDSNIKHFVTKVNKLWVSGLTLSRQASEIYKENRFNLIHAHGSASWVAGILLKWSYKIPLILSGDNFYTGIKKKSLDEEANEIDQIKRFCLSYANYVLLDTGESTFEYLNKFDVPLEKLKHFDHSIYNLIARGEENKIY